MLICKDCFHDEELRSEVSSNAITDGICSVCGNSGRLIDFSEFHDFFRALLSLFSPVTYGEKTIVDIIQDEWFIFKNKDVAKVLITEVIKTYDCGYSIETMVDYSNEIQNRIAVWDRLKTNIKEKSRFFYQYGRICSIQLPYCRQKST